MWSQICTSLKIRVFLEEGARGIWWEWEAGVGLGVNFIRGLKFRLLMLSSNNVYI